ncbi:MAG: hypothetical protein PVJ62_04820, partial [Deltaproteobacteria bacterium]
MYANFIYFILVLLIYTTYHPPETPHLGPFETLAVFLLGVGILAITTRAAFGVLYRNIFQRGVRGLHGEFDRIFHRQAVLAVIIFAVNIYVLNLKLYVLKIPLFSSSPTLTALLFIGLFMGYLAVIWAGAWAAYRVLFQAEISRRSYVVSSISFNFPVILPWLLISAGMDIINVLPFSTPKRLLVTAEGQLVFFSLFLVALVIVAPS